MVRTRTLSSAAARPDQRYQHDLEWLLVGKAAVQLYGHILSTHLAGMMKLSAEIEYWEEVLDSNAGGGIYYYYLQTSPLRLLRKGREVMRSVRERAVRERTATQMSSEDSVWTVRWGRYWTMVADSVREYDLTTLQSHVMTPLHRCRLEARRKQKQLQRMRDTSACGLGLLKHEALRLDAMDGSDDGASEVSRPAAAGNGGSAGSGPAPEEWKSVVMKSVLLMRATLDASRQVEQSTEEFEDAVFTAVENEAEHRYDTGRHEASAIAELVLATTQTDLPNYVSLVQRTAATQGRPRGVVRYWLPATMSILASGACLSLLYHRKADVIGWLRDFGATVRDFFSNWVVEPLRKTLGTIRHDKDSEIALMSKESLEGDRASLERMVVDFTRDHPDPTAGAFDEAQIAARVREGDLTTVLSAYEKDLQRPFVGTIRGDLIRALLIQIQKTKVDVEVALRGIDNLLKSQELVFAFVGLTPGVLVSIGLARWLAGMFGAREGRSKKSSRTRTVRLLRNVTRILNKSRPSGAHELLSFKDHGLLLCEVDLLRATSARVLGGTDRKEFLQDTNDLVDLSMGITRQQQAVDRIWRGYWQWLQ